MVPPAQGNIGQPGGQHSQGPQGQVLQPDQGAQVKHQGATAGAPTPPTAQGVGQPQLITAAPIVGSHGLFGMPYPTQPQQLGNIAAQ